MDLSSLSTSSINNLINQYKTNETNRRIQHLEVKKSKYSNSSSAYGTLSSKLGGLKSILETLKATGTSSIFTSKTANLSSSSFFTATASDSASLGSSSVRVNQLAKSDVAVSTAVDTSLTTANSLGYTDGTYQFRILTGDGSGTSQYSSNISVDLNAADTNSEILEKIKDAINNDTAEISSSSFVGTNNYTGGQTSIKINVNGTETIISDSTATTYEELIDSITNSINTDVEGLTAEKVVDGTNVSLKITADDPSSYFSISHESGFDSVTDLGISADKEKAASATVNASVFSAETGTSQMSITSKESGLDYRITSISDSSGAGLANIGLNLGSSRPSFDQATNTSGFIYSDITSANNELNSKLSFNGLSIQRNSNTINDIVSGVTFNLKSVMDSTDNDVSMTVKNDTEEIKTQIQDFVNKFNDVYKFIKNNSLSEDGVRGPFVGDSTATDLRIRLGNLAYSQVSGVSDTTFNKLSSIGITFDSTNGLSVSDSSLLENSIDNNIDEVESLFNSTDGIANQFYDFVKPYLDSDGYLANIQDSFDNNISYLNDKIESAKTQISKSSETLRSKYEEMQRQVLVLLNNQSLYNSIASMGNTSMTGMF